MFQLFSFISISFWLSNETTEDGKNHAKSDDIYINSLSWHLLFSSKKSERNISCRNRSGNSIRFEAPDNLTLSNEFLSEQSVLFSTWIIFDKLPIGNNLKKKIVHWVVLMAYTHTPAESRLKTNASDVLQIHHIIKRMEFSYSFWDLFAPRLVSHVKWA